MWNFMRYYQKIYNVAWVKESHFITFLNYLLSYVGMKKIRQLCLPTVNKSDLKLKLFESDYRCGKFYPPNWRLMFDNLQELFCLGLWTSLVTHKWLPKLKMKVHGAREIITFRKPAFNHWLRWWLGIVQEQGIKSQNVVTPEFPPMFSEALALICRGIGEWVEIC